MAYFTQDLISSAFSKNLGHPSYVVFAHAAAFSQCQTELDATVSKNTTKELIKPLHWNSAFKQFMIFQV